MSEVVRDVIELKSSIEEKIDIISAVNQADQDGRRDIGLLLAYSSGYSVSELANIHKTHSTEIRARIVKALELLLDLTQYSFTDIISRELEERLLFG